jgi:hypothetical protein
LLILLALWIRVNHLLLPSTLMPAASAGFFLIALRVVLCSCDIVGSLAELVLLLIFSPHMVFSWSRISPFNVILRMYLAFGKTLLAETCCLRTQQKPPNKSTTITKNCRCSNKPSTRLMLAQHLLSLYIREGVGPAEQQTTESPLKKAIDSAKQTCSRSVCYSSFLSCGEAEGLALGGST